MRMLWVMCLCWFIASVQAQESTPQAITDQDALEGRIDNTQSRIRYTLNGVRGEVVRFNLETLDGTLDPILVIFTPSGEMLLNRDDHEGDTDIELSMTLEENGDYTIIVGRIGYDLGATSGNFRLNVERVGVVSQEGSSLRYGVPVTGTITNADPQIYYTFQAQQGQIINIEMVRESGNLDPYLQMVDGDRFLLAENDDADGNTRNALIQGFVVPATGTYIIVATRYGETAGTSVGNFVLTVGETNNSGLGNSRLAPATLQIGQTVQDSLTRDRFQRFYQLNAVTDQVITVTMERSGSEGLLDAYLVLANAGFQPLVEDDDGGGGQNARISRFRIPADGLYYLIATRFDGADGTTFGAYTLTVQDNGFAFANVPNGVPRLLYGTSLQDSISDQDPESLFAFWGQRGELVIISMDRISDNLDPVLELLDDVRTRIVRDDDSGANSNARIERFALPYTGVYYIRATRYEGNNGNNGTTGNFTLTLTTAPPENP